MSKFEVAQLSLCETTGDSNQLDIPARVEALRPYVPDLIINAIADQTREGRTGDLQPVTYETAAVLHVDIKGFTALADLLSHQRDGQTKLVAILNSFFGAFVDIVYKHGGDVYVFAGDAITILVPPGNPQSGDQTTDLLARVIAIEDEILQYVREHGSIPDIKDHHKQSITLQVRIGRDIGSCTIIPGKHGTLLHGRTVQNAFAAEEQATPGTKRIHGQDTCDEPTASSLDTTSPVRSCQRLDQQNQLELLENFVPRGIENEPDHYRLVAVMFLGFELADPDNDQAAITALQDCLQWIDTLAVQKYGGTLNKCDNSAHGYKAIILFGAPVANDRAVYNACEAARETVTALHAIQDGSAIRAKAGVHAGRVFAGKVGSPQQRCEYTVMGESVNLAARLQQRADHAQVLISGDTLRQLNRWNVRHTDLGEQQLKGFETAIPVHTYEGNNGELIGPAIGRKTEIAQIHDAISTSRSEKRGVLVTISADANLTTPGKTRLALASAESSGHPYIVLDLPSYADTGGLQVLRPLIISLCGPEAIQSNIAFSEHLADSGLLLPYQRALLDFMGWPQSGQEPPSEGMMQDAITAFIELTAQRRDGLIIIIDDFQHTRTPRGDNSAVRAVIRSLGRSLSAPISIIAAGRTSSTLPALLKPADTDLAIELGNLRDDQQLAEFITQGIAPAYPEATGCSYATPGMPEVIELLRKDKYLGTNSFSPYHASQVIEYLINNQVIAVQYNQLGDYQITIDRTQEAALSINLNTVNSILEARFDALPSHAQQFLRICAVAGAAVRIQTLMLIFNCDEKTIKDEATSLSGDWLALQDDRISFLLSHLAMYVYERLGVADRMMHHVRFINALEIQQQASHDKNELPANLSSLSYHADQAFSLADQNQVDRNAEWLPTLAHRVFTYSLLVARTAASRNHLAQASIYYRRALNEPLLAHMSQNSPVVFDALEEAARVEAELGNDDMLIAYLERAQNFADQDVSTDMQRIQLKLDLALAQTSAPEQAVQDTVAALALLDETDINHPEILALRVWAAKIKGTANARLAHQAMKDSNLSEAQSNIQQARAEYEAGLAITNVTTEQPQRSLRARRNQFATQELLSQQVRVLGSLGFALARYTEYAVRYAHQDYTEDLVTYFTEAQKAFSNALALCREHNMPALAVELTSNYTGILVDATTYMPPETGTQLLTTAIESINAVRDDLPLVSQKIRARLLTNITFARIRQPEQKDEHAQTDAQEAIRLCLQLQNNTEIANSVFNLALLATNDRENHLIIALALASVIDPDVVEKLLLELQAMGITVTIPIGEPADIIQQYLLTTSMPLPELNLFLRQVLEHPEKYRKDQ
ncbi:MAG TPA: adenylate/guanylate cyclase domain-containing protein [bacterium]|nr:adenylate/guanylate cyclase domain-containing protein [bacterium]